MFCPRLSGTANRAAIAALFAMFLLPACTVTERQVAEQGGRINGLQERVLRLERALQEASVPVPTTGVVDEQLARRLADLGQQVEEISDQLRTLQGRIDNVERSVISAGSPTDAMPLTELEREIASLSERVAVMEAQRAATPVAVTPSAPTPAVRPPATAQPTPAPTPAAAPLLAGQELYDHGYALYKQGRFEEARKVLQQYVDANPSTKLTDNAWYWIGESYYDQAQYEQAILEYDKVIQQFPDGDKVASALLKQAFAFDAIGDPVDAKILLRKLLREHPSSEQAGIARKKLEILGE